jgi:hypothetical protein
MYIGMHYDMYDNIYVDIKKTNKQTKSMKLASGEHLEIQHNNNGSKANTTRYITCDFNATSPISQ